MMLRVVLFEIYRRYRLRLAPGATVTKNTVVTTKPAAVPVIRVPREPARRQRRRRPRCGERAGRSGAPAVAPRVGPADGDPARRAPTAIW